jgi:uncharacterized protein
MPTSSSGTDVPTAAFGGCYEPVDTKLARRVKLSALIQLCDYAQQATQVEGTAPGRVHVITGDNVRHSFALDSLAAFHRFVRRRFEAAVAAGVEGTYPNPVAHCAVCRWDEACRAAMRGTST